MTENTLRQEGTSAVQDEDEISLLDLLIVLAKHKKMILGMTFGAAVIAAIYSLTLPNIYTATVKILPPQSSQSSSSMLLAQLGGQFGGLAGGATGIKNPNDVYIAMLKTRDIADNLIRKFDLQKRYEAKTIGGARKVLEVATSISSGKDGVISVSVDDQNPKSAAAMANFYIEELKHSMNMYSVTEASRRRLFFEQQLKPARDRLTDAEILLDKTPATSLQYLDAVRGVKYQEALYEILSKQYEMARLDEAKDAGFVQVLESAVEPERKSKPKRSQIVILTALVALSLAIVWAFIKDLGERSRQNPEQAERLSLLRRYLGGK